MLFKLVLKVRHDNYIAIKIEIFESKEILLLSLQDWYIKGFTRGNEKYRIISHKIIPANKSWDIVL